MRIKESIRLNQLILLLNKVKSNQLTWVMTFSLLTFLSAQILIPTQPVPFTLQTMIVLLAGAFLGSKNGAISQIIYLVAGALGLPFFAGFSFGLGKLFGPTGGYLLSFPFAAFIVGYILEKKDNSITILLSFVLGELIILLGGASYLSVFLDGNFKQALFSGAIIFSVWDIVKIAAAFGIYKSFSAYNKKQERYSELPK